MTVNRPVHPTSYLDLLRAVAIVLVVNSHLDEVYPIPQLGTGGVFGNELFFFISGYGLYLGYQASREAIGSWLKRRLTRVYEPLFVVATFLVLVGDAHIRSFSDFFFLYIVPLQFWFLPTIFGCYVPIYFIMSKM
jgi:peptidoglycan/LPS O-acetylase OafA/YrhL